ncbi:uncharacterized protein LOC144865306 [Branchiostoma floridae x Branchiostoma japonicum]
MSQKTSEKSCWQGQEEKNCQELLLWKKSIGNHLWSSAKTCQERAELLREKWRSILNHICNRHRWSGNSMFHKCEHLPLTARQKKKKKWMKMGSAPHKALAEVVLETTLLKDMSQMTKFKHTGNLEVHHNVVLKYAPKRTHFTYPVMRGRLQLSVIDNNENIGRGPARTAIE